MSEKQQQEYLLRRIAELEAQRDAAFVKGLKAAQLQVAKWPYFDGASPIAKAINAIQAEIDRVKAGEK